MKRYFGLILLSLTACSTQTPKPTTPLHTQTSLPSTYKNRGQNTASTRGVCCVVSYRRSQAVCASLQAIS